MKGRRPGLGAFSGFFLGLFLAFDLFLLKVIASDSALFVVLPLLLMVVGIGLGLAAPALDRAWRRGLAAGTSAGPVARSRTRLRPVTSKVSPALNWSPSAKASAVSTTFTQAGPKRSGGRVKATFSWWALKTTRKLSSTMRAAQAVGGVDLVAVEVDRRSTWRSPTPSRRPPSRCRRAGTRPRRPRPRRGGPGRGTSAGGGRSGGRGAGR